MKRCSRCKLVLDETLFYRETRRKDGLNPSCKKCINKVTARWRKNNPEKEKIINERSNKKNIEKRKKYSREYQRIKRFKYPEKAKEDQKKWERNNPEKVKATRKKAFKKYYDKHKDKLYKEGLIWRKNNPKLVKEYGRKAVRLSRIKYPEKAKARSLVGYAVKIGILMRPKVCSRCNEEGYIEGHHFDYSKPLEVIWLCRKCHAKEHLTNKEE